MGGGGYVACIIHICICLLLPGNSRVYCTVQVAVYMYVTCLLCAIVCVTLIHVPIHVCICLCVRCVLVCVHV